MRTNATDASIVVTGAMTRRIKGKTVVMDFCSVSAQPADHRALDVRLRQVIGRPQDRHGLLGNAALLPRNEELRTVIGGPGASERFARRMVGELKKNRT